MLIFILLCALLVVISANPVTYVSNDLIDTRQSLAEKSTDVASSNLDSDLQLVNNEDSLLSLETSSQDATVVADTGIESDPTNSLGVDCTLDSSTNDPLNDYTQKRSIGRRQGQKTCPNVLNLPPKGFRPPSKGFIPPPKGSPVGVTVLSPPTQRDSDAESKKTTATENNPCTKPSQSSIVPTQSVHVSCGGSMIGDFATHPDFVLNCVPGVAHEIEARTVFGATRNLGQYCCYEHFDNPLFYMGNECYELVEPPHKVLELWSQEYFSEYLNYVAYLQAGGKPYPRRPGGKESGNNP